MAACSGLVPVKDAATRLAAANTEVDNTANDLSKHYNYCCINYDNMTALMETFHIVSGIIMSDLVS